MLQTLRGHKGVIYQIAWSSDGQFLASASEDATVGLWNGATGQFIRKLEGHSSRVTSVAWSPDQQWLASGANDLTTRVWDGTTGECYRILEGHRNQVRSVAWSPDGSMLASGSYDGTIRLWNTLDWESHQTLHPRGGDHVLHLAWSPDGKILAVGSHNPTQLWDTSTGTFRQIRLRDRNYVGMIAWSPDGQTLTTGTGDGIITRWGPETGRQINILESHTNAINCLSYSCDGRLLASKSRSGTIRLWRCDNWETIAVFQDIPSPWRTGLAFHPTNPTVLATVGKRDTVIHLWRLDDATLLGATPSSEMQHYRNAKVALVGDTGVGKSGLALVLMGQQWKETGSTHGRSVWAFDSHEETLPNGHQEHREILLWDLAGQPGYRLIHQLHLNEVTMALVVFDSRSETDPLTGVRYWSRALRQAHQLQGDTVGSLTTYLVAARADCGGIPVSRKRIDAIVREFGFDAYFETSAKEGWQISDLIATIREGINWNVLPKISSNALFQTIKQFLIEEKHAIRILSTVNSLYRSFCHTYPEFTDDHELQAKFDTCLGRVENRGLIRRLSFGGYVLLQPELLDAYASAIVNTAKSEPDGLGFIPEEDVLIGRFTMPAGERVTDKEQEKLLLIATVEELLQHELVLKEITDNGTDLIFPSQLTRERPEALAIPGKAIIFTFDGSLLNIYATLAVRLSHSHWFTKKEMWKNVATFTAKVDGTCGIYVREINEGRGELTLFFENNAKKEARDLFEVYIHTHLQRRALPGSIHWHRMIVCPTCGTSISEEQVKKRLEFGKDWIMCNVDDTRISLLIREKAREAISPSALHEMDRYAQETRNSDVGMVSARGEMITQEFITWTGSTRAILAMVFTDVVGSTEMWGKLGDETMNEVLHNHFTKSREFIKKYNGYEIKTIGDAFFVAFRTAVQALDFALSLYHDTGDTRIKIRAGIHAGPVMIKENDAFGNTVNYTARVIGTIKKGEIWLSSQAKEHIAQFQARQHSGIRWMEHTDCELKGFSGKHTLWSVDLVSKETEYVKT